MIPFWKKKKPEAPKNETAVEFAARFLLLLSERNDVDKIMAMMVEQVMPGYHVHKNPVKQQTNLEVGNG